MSTYTIGQVAERTGFSTSTLRFYEQHGLLEPTGRSDAGYRLYDDTSLARLGFIDRAKQLGCTLDEIADLAELWEADDCGPVQAHLHKLVTARIADAQRRSRELVAFTARLRRSGPSRRQPDRRALQRRMRLPRRPSRFDRKHDDPGRARSTRRPDHRLHASRLRDA